ncbi:MAG: GNAT family N-acetyltransferase [Ruminococcus sp.]|nr:GNAT family N-acetyltransferase [Ruminococcus sp.]
MTVYRTHTDRDLPQLKKIWLSCFEEKEEAAELFFERNKGSFHAYVCEEDGGLVSALYLIDCILNGEKAHYLCGAATLPEYRGRGSMSALIAYALDDAKRRGDCFSLLFPASDSLYGFYAKYAYQPSCAVKSAELDTDTERKQRVGFPDLHTLQTEYADKNSLFWDDGFIRFAADYYGCYGAKTAQSADAFAIFQPDGDFAEVYYALYSDIEALKALLADQGVKRFRLMTAADDPLLKGKITKPFGMILPLCGGRAPENVFIGITLQ